MKQQKLLSVFLILFIAYLSANAQDDLPPNAEPGKCYAQIIYSDKYTEDIKQIYEYTGTDYKAKGVKKEVVLLSPATTRWEKGKPDPNCQSEDPEDCMVMCLVDVPAKSVTYYVVTDSSINKQFKITKLSTRVLEQIGGRSGWTEVLCEKDMNRTIIQNVNWQLIELGYLDENLLNDAGMLGRATKIAIRDYQEVNGLPIGGALNIPLLEHLGLH